MAMQLMNLIIGEKYRSVMVSDLIWKEHPYKGKTRKEIVAVTMYVTEPGKMFSKDNSFILSSKKDSNLRFQCLDFEEYKIDSLNAPNGVTTRISVTRNIPDFIVMDEVKEEGKEDKLSKGYPVVIMDETDSFEKKEAVYHMIRNGITTPMIQNMTNTSILAGHLHQEKEVAELALKKVITKDVSIKLPRGIFQRTKYLLEVYNNWVETMFVEMANNDLIKELHVYLSTAPIKAYEILVDEEKIEPLISQLLKDGKLSFTEEKKFDEITGFNEHMGYFSEMMGSMIQSMAKPLHRNGDIRPDVLDLAKQLKRTPFQAQLNTIEACIKSLEHQKRAILISEPGTGKTLMMMSIHWMLSKIEERTMKLLVLSPDHLVEDVWEDELLSTLPDVKVHQITSVNDLVSYEKQGFLDDDIDRAFILAQKHSREAVEYKPSVSWGPSIYKSYDARKAYLNRGKSSFKCPVCAEEVVRKIKHTDDTTGETYYTLEPVKFNYFSSRRQNNNKCKKCNTVLWEPINREMKRKSTFLYSNDLKGFYPRDVKVVRNHIEELVHEHSQAKVTGDTKKATSIKKEIAEYKKLESTISGKIKEGNKRSVKKVGVADYIFKKMQYRFTNLIVDELHEYQNDSKRSSACEKLVHSVRYVMTGTGTGMNGYADSRFKNDYMLQPETMKKAGYTINDKDKYQATFGVVEKRYRLIKKNDGKFKKSALSPKKRPGISPIIFPLFMQGITYFMTMDDLKEEMPELAHVNEPVEMDDALKAAHKDLVKKIKLATKYDKRLFKNTIRMNYSFLDTPSVMKELKDKETGEVIVETPTVTEFEDKKLQRFLQIAEREIEVEDNRMIVYTSYAGDNINGYLAKNLEKKGYKVTILSPQGENSISCDGSLEKVNKEDREKYIRREVAKGSQVLMVNPELVKTGCNLIDFSTILYYQMGYQVYTNRQADRRTWRIGQKKACKIIYLYYKESIQEQVASLMATKIVASQAIEGNMDANGLENLVQERTAEEELAKMFYDGIKDAPSITKASA